MAKKAAGAARAIGDTVRAAFRGKITLVVSSEPVQRVQLSGLADETLQDLEHLQEYGFTSNPPEGTEAVVIPLGGNTSHGVVVATQHGSFRIKNLSPGETAVYNSDGAQIVLKNGKIIEATCEVFKVNCKHYEVNAGSGATFDTPMLTATQQVTATGQINGNGGMAVQGGGGAKFTGNVEMVGNLNTTGALTNNGKDVGSRHKHIETQGAQTGEVV
ncbi:putative baseplate assembly protein V [Bergeriella denitrificans]|uniref:Putative baseplate assembly protein V n=2 Tax=Bergeriella denitrificans TaxID=494 RepID=A0A378UHX8_BERDE|nr:putative baseplate assembly protein V [Bergeriella denitrificans]